MIVFLDFDGVLHPVSAEVDRLFCCAKHFWAILDRHPNANVVFSTSWRQQYPISDLVNFATHGGGENFASRFIGTTPTLKCNDNYQHRRRECQAWLAENSWGGPWIAFDDMALLWGFEQSANVYIVDHRHGLREHDVVAASARIQRLAR